jgi:hypothetical protein
MGYSPTRGNLHKEIKDKGGAPKAICIAAETHIMILPDQECHGVGIASPGDSFHYSPSQTG